MAVNFYPGAMASEILGPEGIVGREVQRMTLKVHAMAVSLTPVKTGRLRSSVRWVMATDAHGPFGLVSTDVEYGFFVHEGTKHMAARHFLTDALEAAK